MNFGSKFAHRKTRKSKIGRVYRGLNQAPRKLLKLNDGGDKAVV